MFKKNKLKKTSILSLLINTQTKNFKVCLSHGTIKRLSHFTLII